MDGRVAVFVLTIGRNLQRGFDTAKHVENAFGLPEGSVFVLAGLDFRNESHFKEFTVSGRQALYPGLRSKILATFIRDGRINQASWHLIILSSKTMPGGHCHQVTGCWSGCMAYGKAQTCAPQVASAKVLNTKHRPGVARCHGRCHGPLFLILFARCLPVRRVTLICFRFSRHAVTSSH